MILQSNLVVSTSIATSMTRGSSSQFHEPLRQPSHIRLLCIDTPLVFRSQLSQSDRLVLWPRTFLVQHVRQAPFPLQFLGLMRLEIITCKVNHHRRAPAIQSLKSASHRRVAGSSCTVHTTVQQQLGRQNVRPGFAERNFDFCRDFARVRQWSGQIDDHFLSEI